MVNRTQRTAPNFRPRAFSSSVRRPNLLGTVAVRTSLRFSISDSLPRIIPPAERNAGRALCARAIPLRIPAMRPRTALRGSREPARRPLGARAGTALAAAGACIFFEDMGVVVALARATSLGAGLLAERDEECGGIVRAPLRRCDGRGTDGPRPRWSLPAGALRAAGADGLLKGKTGGSGVFDPRKSRKVGPGGNLRCPPGATVTDFVDGDRRRNRQLAEI